MMAVGSTLRRMARERLLPDWSGVLERNVATWTRARETAAPERKVLLATSVGGNWAAAILESLLAVALTLRGARVEVLLCDEVLPACFATHSVHFSDPREFVTAGPQRHHCRDCFAPALRLIQPLGLTIHRYSALLTADERRHAAAVARSVPVAAIPTFTLEGMAVGEHAFAGALRFFARGTLDGEATGEAVARRFFEAALLSAFAVRRLISTGGFTSAVCQHGIYVPFGIIGEAARRRAVRMVTWNPAYRKKRFIFSHGDTYHHTLLDEPVGDWEQIAWTSDMESELLVYLKSRWHGTRDWIYFHEQPEENIAVIARQVGVDLTKPTIGLLTNVFWDAQLHYRSNAFRNMMDWVHQTIAYFGRRPELQLVIRVHPAEIRGFVPSRQLVVDEIRHMFPRLPSNVFVIPPDSNVSTYVLMSQCNAVLIYGTKTGVELTSVGIPVIVAGEAWIRNKGLTLDASSPDEYFRLLDRLPLLGRMDEAALVRARKYAYHFFFRRMIPIACVEPARRLVPYQVRVSGLGDLMPGRDPGLDVICRGIVEGAAFIYPEERLRTSLGAGEAESAGGPRRRDA